MYCMSCGANNRDGAGFCTACGKELRYEIPAGKSAAEKKNRKWYMFLIPLVLIVTIVVATVFDFWPWSGGSDEVADNNRAQDAQTDAQPVAQRAVQTTNENGAVTFEHFSLSAIIAQCPDCEQALDTYCETLRASQDWMTSKEEMDALTMLKWEQMQHFCTAEAIYVEDIPYSYRGSFGLYTGDWLGAGPAGKGTYIGTVYGLDIVSYTGDWGFGLPDGAGELYVEKYFGNWDMTYRGHLKNGKRHGWGSMSDYSDGGGYREPLFRLFDEAEYTQDQLTEWIDCVEYNAETGDIMQYCKMKTDETGTWMQGETWGKNDLSPEMENALGIAAAVFSLGFLAYMTYSAITMEDDWDPQASKERVMSMTNDLRANAEKRAQEMAEEEERIKQDNKKKAQDKLEDMDAGYTKYDANYEKYWESILYGN